jgi:hypothetical protein
MMTNAQVMDFFKRWTPVVKEARAFVLALVALLAALAALITAIRYVGDVARTQEQTKAAMGVLVAGQGQLASQTESNHRDIAALREYLATEAKDGDGIPDGPGGAASASPPPTMVRPPTTVRTPPTTARTPPPPKPPESAAPVKVRMPPEVSPPPAPVKGLDVDDIYQ